MTHRTLVYLLLFVGGLGLSILHADPLPPVTVGSQPTGCASNSVTTTACDYVNGPFASSSVVGFQQFYSLSGGPVELTGLGFQVDMATNGSLGQSSPEIAFGSSASVDYQVYLSVFDSTTIDPATSIASRVGAGPAGTLVFDNVGSVSCAALTSDCLFLDNNGLLTATFATPFLFDPTSVSNPELLVDIERVSAPSLSLNFVLQADPTLTSATVTDGTLDTSCTTGCVYDGTTLPQSGLVTTFYESTVPGVPEPSSLGVWAAVLLALVLIAGRRSPARMPR